jgi:hypothetical protein
MKFNGKAITREIRQVELPRSSGDPIRLSVSSITVGVRRDFDALWPRPKVPIIVTQGKNGREEKEDWRDTTFTAELDERSTLQNIYLMYRVLENDPNLVFDNKPTDKATLRLLADEIKNSGLSEGDIVVILKEALKASNLDQEEINKVKGDF